MLKIQHIWPVIFLAILVYLGLSIFADFNDLTSAVSNFHLYLIPLVLMYSTITTLIRFLVWDTYRRNTGVRLHLKESLFVFLSSIPMTLTPGKSGEFLWTGWVTKQINGDPMSKTMPVPVMGRATDVLSLLILSMVGIAHYQQGIYIIFILCTIMTVFFVLARWRRVSQIIVTILGKRAQKYTDNVHLMHSSFASMMKFRILIPVLALDIFAWFFDCLALYFVVHGFGESISLDQACFVFAFATLVGGFSMIPGGVGVAEIGMVGLLALFDVDQTSAVGSTIIFRFAALWYPVIVGFMVYILSRRYYIGKRKPNKGKDSLFSRN